MGEVNAPDINLDQTVEEPKRPFYFGNVLARRLLIFSCFI